MMKIVMIYLKSDFVESGTPQWNEELDIHKQYLIDILGDTIIAIGPFTDHTGGLVIVEADNVDEITNIAKNDPAVLSGMLNYEVHCWAPFQGIFNVN